MTFWYFFHETHKHQNNIYIYLFTYIRYKRKKKLELIKQFLNENTEMNVLIIYNFTMNNLIRDSNSSFIVFTLFIIGLKNFQLKL